MTLDTVPTAALIAELNRRGWRDVRADVAIGDLLNLQEEPQT